MWIHGRCFGGAGVRITTVAIIVAAAIVIGVKPAGESCDNQLLLMNLLARCSGCVI